MMERVMGIEPTYSFRKADFKKPFITNVSRRY